jgi:hypothetical protein
MLFIGCHYRRCLSIVVRKTVHHSEYLYPPCTFNVYRIKIGHRSLLTVHRHCLPSFLLLRRDRTRINLTNTFVSFVFQMISAEHHAATVVVQDTHHAGDERRPYATRAAPESLSNDGRKHSVSVVDVHDPSSTVEFHRPRRTTRSVSPSSSFRYILPFNSERDQSRRTTEETSLGNRQNVPITVTTSPMYTKSEYF